MLITGCAGTHSALDGSYFRTERINAPPFLLTAREHIENQNAEVNLYIEGDGRAWIRRTHPSHNPTPKYPVAYRLALLDPSKNVIYLARPCQYTELSDELACAQKYWTSHRFAPEVIDAMDSAIEDMKQRHQIKGFNLIGFSGGGNIVALLAERRDDILSFRTVAGNMDHQLQSQIHDVSKMPQSLNAADIADKISHIPQIHYVGAQDKVVPLEIALNYEKKAGEHRCIRIQEIEKIKHTIGWEDAWPTLIQGTPFCEVPADISVKLKLVHNVPVAVAIEPVEVQALPAEEEVVSVVEADSEIQAVAVEEEIAITNETDVVTEDTAHIVAEEEVDDTYILQD